MAVQNKRQVSTLLWVAIFMSPFVFSWFTLRKGFSTFARVVAFSWMTIMIWPTLYMLKPKFQEIAMLFGVFPEHVKAQQCLTVSHFLPENEADIWRKASSKRIDYWLQHQSGCQSPIDCMDRLQRLASLVQRMAAPDGDKPSQRIIKKWMSSNYCRSLVASYRPTLISNMQATQQTIEQAEQNLLGIKLYFSEINDQPSKRTIKEAADFQKNKTANFCYDTDRLNSINLKLSGRAISLVLTDNTTRSVFFEKTNINTDIIIYNNELKVEPGPANFEIKITQGGNVVFTGNVTSYGCT